MLNRRILRVKAFKVLYAYAENQDLTLKEALASLDASCEATRDLYLYMMAVIPALTAEAARRIEAARGKFNPTEEDLNPRMRFAENAVSALLLEDPDFKRLTEKKKISWANNDALVHNLYETLKTRAWFQAYLDGKEASLQADVRLWQQFFQEELEDNEELLAILEDSSIFWADELPYVLGTCIRSLEEMGKTGRWSYPPLYQSDVLAAQGKPAESDHDFVHKLVTAAYGRYAEYSALVAGSVSKWDQDRLYTTDTVLIVMGLTEAETFPNIPVKVSINEYVEISKYYSTPKSRGFVNGLLDRLMKEKGLL
ncbi:MAG: transcription antitermination protein NusB [Bacteroidales bacterium]|jgi:N utilization substance protein B|nr:transcription antitermination protein NusB [Bacteroidales bacterium]